MEISRRGKPGYTYCLECKKIRNKNYHKSHKAAYARKSNLKLKYGLSLEQYREALIIQNNKCLICTEEFTKTPASDHSHSSGKFRGLLCSKCNSGLGFFRDSVEYLERAKNYLISNA